MILQTELWWDQLGHEMSLGPSLGPHGRRPPASKAKSAHGNAASGGEGTVCRKLALAQGYRPRRIATLPLQLGSMFVMRRTPVHSGRQGCSISDNIAGSFTRSITEQILLPFLEHFQCLGQKKIKDRKTKRNISGNGRRKPDEASACSPG